MNPSLNLRNQKMKGEPWQRPGIGNMISTLYIQRLGRRRWQGRIIKEQFEMSISGVLVRRTSRGRVTSRSNGPGSLTQVQSYEEMLRCA